MSGVQLPEFPISNVLSNYWLKKDKHCKVLYYIQIDLWTRIQLFSNFVSLFRFHLRSSVLVFANDKETMKTVKVEESTHMYV